MVGEHLHGKDYVQMCSSDIHSQPQIRNHHQSETLPLLEVLVPFLVPLQLPPPCMGLSLGSFESLATFQHID